MPSSLRDVPRTRSTLPSVCCQKSTCSWTPRSIITGSWSWSLPHGIPETRAPGVAPGDQQCVPPPPTHFPVVERTNLSASPRLDHPIVRLPYGIHELEMEPRSHDNRRTMYTRWYITLSPRSFVLMVQRCWCRRTGSKSFLKLLVPTRKFRAAMLRMSDQVQNSFTPDYHPEKGEWYWILVDAMTEYAGATDPVPPVRQSHTTFVPTHLSARAVTQGQRRNAPRYYAGYPSGSDGHIRI